VIPAKLGGTLVIRAHRLCNNAAAKLIDNPLMGIPDVELLRALSGATNTRTKRFRGTQLPGELGDEARALLRADPSGVTIEQVGPGAIKPDDDGNFGFTLPPTDIERRTEKMLDELRRRFPDKTVELGDQRSMRSQVSISSRVKVHRATWPRFMAKVALGTLSQVMPSSWHGSDAELYLIGLMWLARPLGTTDGLAALPEQLGPGNPWRDLLYPWEHLVYVDQQKQIVRVTLVLFGELRYDLAVRSEIELLSPQLWLCDYRERQPSRFSSLGAFSFAITDRFDLFGSLADLHLERPYGAPIDDPDPRLPKYEPDE
jgi:hypothetical protein